MVFSDAVKMDRNHLRERADWTDLSAALDALTHEIEHLESVHTLVLAEMQKRNPDFTPR